MAKRTVIIFTGMALSYDSQNAPLSQAWLEAAQAAGATTCVISNELQSMLDKRVGLFSTGLIAAAMGSVKFEPEDVITVLEMAGVDIGDCGHIMLIGRGTSSFRLAQAWNGRQLIVRRARLEAARQQNEAGMTCVYLGLDPDLRNRAVESGHYAMDCEEVLAFLQSLKAAA